MAGAGQSGHRARAWRLCLYGGASGALQSVAGQGRRVAQGVRKAQASERVQHANQAAQGGGSQLRADGSGMTCARSRHPCTPRAAQQPGTARSLQRGARLRSSGVVSVSRRRAIQG